MWVPGHSNVLGNYTADSLAKTGSGALSVRPEWICGVPYKAARNKLGSLLRQWHTQHWRWVPREVYSQALRDTHSSAWIKLFISLNQAEARLAAGIIRGHCQLNNTLPTWSHQWAILRRCMEEQVTPLQTLHHCEVFVSNRRTILVSEKLNQEQFRTAPLRMVLTFMKATEQLQ